MIWIGLSLIFTLVGCIYFKAKVPREYNATIEKRLFSQRAVRKRIALLHQLGEIAGLYDVPDSWSPYNFLSREQIETLKKEQPSEGQKGGISGLFGDEKKPSTVVRLLELSLIHI